MKIWTNDRSNNVHTQKALVGKLSPRSTQCTPLHRFGIESQKPGKPWSGKEPGPTPGKLAFADFYKFKVKIATFARILLNFD